MKKFDLKEAKAGKSVISRSKKPVKMLHFTRDNNDFPLVAIIENKHVYCFTSEGRFYGAEDGRQSENDLFMEN